MNLVYLRIVWMMAVGQKVNQIASEYVGGWASGPGHWTAQVTMATGQTLGKS